MRAKKMIAGTAAAIGLGLGVLAGAGVASATPEGDYLYDVRNNGNIIGPEALLLQWGDTACLEHRQGVAQDTSISHIAEGTQLDRQDARFLYESALTNLCPT